MLKYDELKTSFVKPVYIRLVVVAFSCMLLFLGQVGLDHCVHAFMVLFVKLTFHVTYDVILGEDAVSGKVFSGIGFCIPLYYLDGNV